MSNPASSWSWEQYEASLLSRAGKAGREASGTQGCAAPTVMRLPSVFMLSISKTTLQRVCVPQSELFQRRLQMWVRLTTGSQLCEELSLGPCTSHCQETQKYPELWIRKFLPHRKGLGLCGKCYLRTAWIVHGKILPHVQDISVLGKACSALWALFWEKPLLFPDALSSDE